MRRELFKRVIFACTVFLILLNLFTPFSFASSVAFFNQVMPACPEFPTAGQLPYGENTLVVCSLRKTADDQIDYQNIIWYFVYSDPSRYYTYITTSSGSYNYLSLISYSPIYRYRRSGTTWIYEECGSEYTTSGTTVYRLMNDSKYRESGSTYYFVSNFGARYWSMTMEQAEAAQVLSPFTGSVIDDYIAAYPSNVSLAVDSIKADTSLINQYYNTLNGKLNSLSSDHIALSNQISELQSQLNSQGGEYQSALDQAQSEIESNANAAASNAASEVVNAGEDVSDLDNDVDNVSDIVDTLDGWIESLDTFADHIDESTSGVVEALENGKTLFNGFLGVCPPIVIALFGFALVFLVVRKIIGR